MKKPVSCRLLRGVLDSIVFVMNYCKDTKFTKGLRTFSLIAIFLLTFMSFVFFVVELQFRSGLAFLIVKLTDQFYFSFKRNAKALPYLFFDFANEAQNIAGPGIVCVENKSSMFGADHGISDTFAF